MSAPLEPCMIEPTSSYDTETFDMDETTSLYNASSLETDASIHDISGWSDIQQENEGSDPFVVALCPRSTQMAGWMPMGPGAMVEDVHDY